MNDGAHSAAMASCPRAMPVSAHTRAIRQARAPTARDDVVDQEHVADGEHRPPAGRVHHDRDEAGFGRDVDDEAGVRDGACDTRAPRAG